MDSKRCKFSAHFRKTAPIGDPNISSDILWAKYIRKLVTERAGLGDSEELEDDYFEETQDIIYLTQNTGANVIGEVPTESIEKEAELGGKEGRKLSSSERTVPSSRRLVRSTDSLKGHSKKAKKN